jgi:hypothetical protein
MVGEAPYVARNPHKGYLFAIGCVIVGSIRQRDLHQAGQRV